jgi:regulatory protein
VAIREYGAAEMREYLVGKDFSEEVAAEIVAELERESAIDDRRYAAVIVRHLGLRGKGPRFILARLRQKGVALPLSEIQAMFDENLPSGELESARKVVERRYPSAWSDLKTKQRAYQALLRRGFSAEIARKCLKAPSGE